MQLPPVSIFREMWVSMKLTDTFLTLEVSLSGWIISSLIVEVNKLDEGLLFAAMENVAAAGS